MPLDLSQFFSSKRVLVVGDLMTDIYTTGRVERISPEAPVPIIHVMSEEMRPGGAGNAILNMLSLGMQVVACGRVGDDEAGQSMCRAFEQEGVDISGIFIDPTFPTPRKRRLIADNQQLLRVDYEKVAPLKGDLIEHMTEKAVGVLDRVDVVALSDYGKGCLVPSFLQNLIQAATQRRIPILVDPKGRDFSRYHGATLIKPNLREAMIAAGMDMEDALELAAEKIITQCNIDHLMVTRAAHGISLFNRQGEAEHFAAQIHEVRDVTGAGDTVFALVVLGMANKVKLSVAAEVANVAASLAIERFGCARITLQQIEERLRQKRV